MARACGRGDPAQDDTTAALGVSGQARLVPRGGARGQRRPDGHHWPQGRGLGWTSAPPRLVSSALLTPRSRPGILPQGASVSPTSSWAQSSSYRGAGPTMSWAWPFWKEPPESPLPSSWRSTTRHLTASWTWGGTAGSQWRTPSPRCQLRTPPRPGAGPAASSDRRSVSCVVSRVPRASTSLRGGTGQGPGPQSLRRPPRGRPLGPQLGPVSGEGARRLLRGEVHGVSPVTPGALQKGTGTVTLAPLGRPGGAPDAPAPPWA